MRNATLKSAIVAIGLGLGILGTTLPLAAEAAQPGPQCNAVIGCGTLLDYIKELLRNA